MSDSNWNDYLAEATSVDAAVEAEVAPILDAAATDTWQGDNAASWGDWNQEIANDAVTDVQSELDYASEAYAGGFDVAGDAAIARAQYSAEVAENHDATAGDYYGTAASEYEAASAGYATAADTVADTTSYDTTSYDTASYDTASYDTASYDTASYDTASYDTSGGDTGEAV